MATTESHEQHDDAPTSHEQEETSETQVLGSTVLVPKRVTQAEPGSPETGARRDAEGRPVA